MAQRIDLVEILGGGPAGASAAIAARLDGAAVRVIEKSKFPRHKVCGEFLSPEIQAELERLGAWSAFLDASPARIRRMKLHFGRRSKICNLPEPAWGLSRYAFDALLLDRAISLGAEVARQPIAVPNIIAAGRSITDSKRGRRLFGFKAHFTGPIDDAVELFFFNGCYVGVNTVEKGRTNVCGLGPEDYLKRFDFDFDRVVLESPTLLRRLAPLNREMKWLSTGPLRFTQRFSPHESAYLAGDALSFVDPFTGSGLLAAVKSGSLAGTAAARNDSVAAHITRCRASLRKPFEVASMLRRAVDSGWAEMFAGLIPGRMIYSLTRPRALTRPGK